MFSFFLLTAPWVILQVSLCPYYFVLDRDESSMNFSKVTVDLIVIQKQHDFLTRGLADTKGKRCWLKSYQLLHNCTKVVFENACNSQMTLTVTQGHRKWQYVTCY